MKSLLTFLFATIICFLKVNISFAQLGAALNFDGVNDYISIPHNSLLKPSTAITIEIWIKPTTIHNQYYYEIYIKDDAKGRHRFAFKNLGTTLSFGLHIGGIYSELEIPIIASDYENQWVHVAATYDGTVKRIYRNGNLIGSQNITGAIDTSGTAPALVGSWLGSNWFFKGAIDEFRLWSKALSQSEIEQTMHCQSPGDQNGLVIHYAFNQGVAGGANDEITEILDNSSNHLNATATNFSMAGEQSNWVQSPIICYTVYTFIGNGKWSDSNNWTDKMVPPSYLDSGSQIIINPNSNGVCILDTLQFISSGSTITFAQNKKAIISGDLYLTDSSNKVMPSKKIKVLFGADVPEAVKVNTDSIYSALGAIKMGTNSIIDIIKYKEEALVFGFNTQNEILFICLVNKNDSIIKLDAKGSAVAIVRFILNPAGTGNFMPLELNAAIQAAPSFNQLLNVIQQHLINGNSIFTNDSALIKAHIVANEIISANGGLILGRPLENQKYYFIDGLFKGENLWFENITGPDVKFFNDTRLYWQVTSRDEQGVIVNQKKELEWEPFKWEHIIPSIDPPTETLIKVTNTANNTNMFTLILEQDASTRAKHGLFLIHNLLLTLLDWMGRPGTDYSKELECINEVAKTILNDKLPQLLTKGSGTAAIEYMKIELEGIEALWYYENISKCIPLPSLSDVATNQAVKKFLITVVSFWNKIQLAISFATTLNFAAQMAHYWDYSSTQSFCKVDGNISAMCSLPVLATSSITAITQSSAISGGTIPTGNGAIIIARGVCWSTSPYPTIENSKSVNGQGAGTFISNLSGLMARTTYYVRAYATNNSGTEYGNSLTFTTPDAANFPSVTIGDQTWAAKNLDVTTFRNGDIIPQVQDISEWCTITTPAWCYYNNDPANGNTYGKLYNWYAVNDPRGLAPLGWHVPSYSDWETLFMTLGGWVNAAPALCENSTEHWLVGITCPGTNSSGFTGLPSGGRHADPINGNFYNLNAQARWWSSTSSGSISAYEFYITGASNCSANPSVLEVDHSKRHGSAVRCVKD